MIYEFSNYEQFSWNELPLRIKGYLYIFDLYTSTHVK
jgi:hypothetical protein